MFQEDLFSLVPGSMFGQGSYAESKMPGSALPGGNVTISPQGQVGALNRQSDVAGPYGTKMPLSAIPKTEQNIKEARDATKMPDSYFGIPVSLWHQIGVYGALGLLFLVGVISLLSASGTATISPGGIKLKK